MIIKNASQEKKFREATTISLEIMSGIRDEIIPGILPIELDQIAGELMNSQGVGPSFKTANGKGGNYKYNTCISVNDEALHGIPSSTKKIEKGDLLKLDLGIIYHGIFTDHCFTFCVGEPKTEEDKKLLNVGKMAVETAASRAVAGNTTGDLGDAMHSVAQLSGFDTLKQFIGHGIGNSLWEEPGIPAWGEKGTGDKLKNGMVLCIEAQVVAGKDNVYTADDGWTIKTVDGKNVVMFEYMVLVQKNKPVVLTDNRAWDPILEV